jgi:hypothetical protein
VRWPRADYCDRVRRSNRSEARVDATTLSELYMEEEVERGGSRDEVVRSQR